MNQWSEAVREIRGEPCSVMPSETFKAFCLAIANMQGYVQKVDQPRVVKEYRCDRCGMTWGTGMALDGLPHLAILNRCAGIWRKTAGDSQPVPVVAADSRPAIINGEVYEVDE